MDRMARDTKQPEVVQELFKALGNDPAVIAECLVRPILAERLIADLSSQEPNSARWIPADRRAPCDVDGNDVRASCLYSAGNCQRGACTDRWGATSIFHVFSARGGHTAVWTGSEMIVWGGFNSSGALNTGGRYNPSTDSWRATSTTNAPTARGDHTAVWTGREMIVWGGGNNANLLDTGGRYNPSTDSWTATSTTNAPSARSDQTVVWTGSAMIVWGG